MGLVGINLGFIGSQVATSPVLMKDVIVQKKSEQVLTPLSLPRTPLGDITNNFLCRETNSDVSVGTDREINGEILVLDV